jgi:hypothetical protein
MTIITVHQGVTSLIVIPMYRAGTLNVLSLVTMRWKLIVVIVIPCQTPQAPNILTDKGLKNGLYISIPRKITTALKKVTSALSLSHTSTPTFLP